MMEEWSCSTCLMTFRYPLMKEQKEESSSKAAVKI